MTDITYSILQEKAINSIVEWYGEKNGKQVYLLHGYAGTGKSTVVAEAVLRLRDKYKISNIPVGVYTGKAAHVLRKKGNPNAQTIHSMIYLCVEDEQTGQLNFILNPVGAAANADLIILDECFCKNSMIDTPTGIRHIQDIVPGDKISNAIGIDTVIATRKKEATDAAQIKYNGKTITCSKNHRFFTGRGFVCASDIRPGDTIIRQPEAVRLLRQGILSQDMEQSFLHSELLNAMVAPVPRVQSESLHTGKQLQSGHWSPTFFSIRFGKGKKRDRENTQSKPDFRSGCSSKNKRESQSQWTPAYCARRQWEAITNTATKIMGELRGMLENGIRHFSWEANTGLSYVLQGGYSQSVDNGCYRSGWGEPQNYAWSLQRFKKRQSPSGFRVENSEILELGDSRLDQFREADGKLYLYDLQAERHSSFSVSGGLVHNCSFIDQAMARDLKSFGRRTLVIGDPGQLPPINGEGAFNGTPDFFLDEIHRQAADSPIIRLSVMARQGIPLPVGFHEGDVRVMKLTNATQEHLFNPDTQVLCGVHRIRWPVTQMIRQRNGFTEPFPMPGEQIMCCKNDRDLGMFNGGIGTLKKMEIKGNDYVIDANIEGNFQKKLLVDPYLFKQHFDEGASQKTLGKKRHLFDWCAAMSVHKAQGSGYPHITLIDNSPSFKENAARHLYTGITRSEEGLIILMP